MWSKFTNALKPRQSQEESISTSTLNHGEYRSNTPAEDNQSSPPSPPGSPFRRKSLLKRMSKLALASKEDVESTRASSPAPLKASLSLPQKVKSHLTSRSSYASLSRRAAETTPYSLSFDTPRSSQESSRTSHDSFHSSHTGINASTTSFGNNNDTVRSPLTIDTRFNSVRSILRDPNTPGTGQNVRFFARDAFRVISPNQSTDADQFPTSQPQGHRTASGGSQQTFLERLHHSHPDDASLLSASPPPSNPEPPRTSLLEVFSPEQEREESPASSGANSFSTPLSATVFKPFDGALDLPTRMAPFTESLSLEIPSTLDGPNFGDYGPVTSTPFGKNKASDQYSRPSVLDEKQFTPSGSMHDRSQSFSFGQADFHSLSTASHTSTQDPVGGSHTMFGQHNVTITRSASLSPSSTKGRSRALSDSVFSAFIKPTSPETNINDAPAADLRVSSPSSQTEPDPFNARANTYYTPQSMIPATPPGPSHQLQKASKEKNLIFSLKTQLNLQTELCSQYEADLRARDEVVEVLSQKVQDMEKEESKRKNALRQWKKKVAELEKTCRYLEEEVEGSRQESMERSIMDEADGEALRMLHRQIASLEKERNDSQGREETLREELARLEGEVHSNHETSLLSDPIDQAGKSRASQNRALGDKERADLLAGLHALEEAKQALETTLDELQLRLRRSTEEYGRLKDEEQAQRVNAAQATARMTSLEEDNLKLEEAKAELEKKVSDMEFQWNDSENRRNKLEDEIEEIWDIKAGLEAEKHRVEKQLQEQQDRIEELNHSLQESADRINKLENECQFAVGDNEQLQEHLRKRDKEMTELARRVRDNEAQNLRLQEEMSRMRREHTEVVEEHARDLQDAIAQRNEMQLRLEESIEAAGANDELQTMKTEIGPLRDEVNKLRRQVNELQQGSADKEVKIVQLTRQRAQDKDDLAGLNIALDSKQQELELLKRRVGVRGTAGSTPAELAAKSGSASHQQRESSATTRPASVTSIGSDSGKNITNRDRRASTLVKSAKANDPVASSAVKVVSRTETSPIPSTAKSRSSITSTSPTPRAPSRSAPNVATVQRRVSPSRATSSRQPPVSGMSTASSTTMSKVTRQGIPSIAVGGQSTDEKENVDVHSDLKTRNMVPLPS